MDVTQEADMETSGRLLWDQSAGLMFEWVRTSTDAGRPWIVAFDESGSAAHAQCPDLGYKGFDGRDRSGRACRDGV